MCFPIPVNTVTSIECPEDRKPGFEADASFPAWLPHLGHVHQNSQVGAYRTTGSRCHPHLGKAVDAGPVKTPGVQGPRILVGLRQGQEVPTYRAPQPGCVGATAKATLKVHFSCRMEMITAHTSWRFWGLKEAIHVKRSGHQGVASTR